MIFILFVIAVPVCGIVGWVIGAIIGGNMDAPFTYQGLPGYEGTGMLGFHIGIVLGCVLMVVICYTSFRRLRARFFSNPTNNVKQ